MSSKYKKKMQAMPMTTLILRAWDKDRDKLLRELGGIDGDYRNEERIRQIEQTIESIKQSQQDDEREQSAQ